MSRGRGVASIGENRYFQYFHDFVTSTPGTNMGKPSSQHSCLPRCLGIQPTSHASTRSGGEVLACNNEGAARTPGRAVCTTRVRLAIAIVFTPAGQASPRKTPPDTERSYEISDADAERRAGVARATLTACHS